MKQIIEEISNLLKKNSFRDEQHVRFSIVGRICQALGWDIWNPEEFYTEYPVKKYAPKEKDKELRGRVDVALILSDKRSEVVDVYIEVKAPGRLQNELAAAEYQLQEYNFWDKAAISILTDGIIWRFYLPSVGGSFVNGLFNEFNLLEGSPEAIANAFKRILKRDDFRVSTVKNAEAMHEELRKIKLIQSIKDDAEHYASETGISVSEIAQRLLQNRHKENIGITEIELLWCRSVPGVDDKVVVVPVADQDSYDMDNNFKFKKPTKVYVIDEWYPVRNWRGFKKTVYLKLQARLVGLDLGKLGGISQDQTIFRNPISLKDGYYCEGHGSSSALVNHCKKALISLGIDYKSAVRIEIASKRE